MTSFAPPDTWPLPYTPKPTGRVYCIGMNYRKHVAELGNAVPEKPVVFMKPADALVRPDRPIVFPRHGRELHHEVELVLVIGCYVPYRCTEEQAVHYIGGVGLGLDLTLRDVQAELRKKGLPWEAAKSIDGSITLGPTVPVREVGNLGALEFSCLVNGVVRQQGHTSDMIVSPAALVCAVAEVWDHNPGDLIYTGTPQGVGPLEVGDEVAVEAPWVGRTSWTVMPARQEREEDPYEDFWRSLPPGMPGIPARKRG